MKKLVEMIAKALNNLTRNDVTAYEKDHYNKYNTFGFGKTY